MNKTISSFWFKINIGIELTLRPSQFELSPQKNWVTGRFLRKIDCEMAPLSPISATSSDISGQVTHGENLECDQVLSAWHFIFHRPCDRHPIGHTAAQMAPEHLTSRPFNGVGGLLPHSCHCLFDLLWFKMFLRKKLFPSFLIDYPIRIRYFKLS